MAEVVPAALAGGMIPGRPQEADWAPALALPVSDAFWAVPVAGAPASAVFDRNRPVGEYNDCTWYHLPAWNGRADLPKNADAMLAIFAARMALSSFEIRSRFK